MAFGGEGGNTEHRHLAGQEYSVISELFHLLYQAKTPRIRQKHHKTGKITNLLKIQSEKKSMNVNVPIANSLLLI